MAVVCPTVLAASAEEYAAQLGKVQAFAPRIQIDLADGKFAPNKTISPAQVYLPENIPVDIHLMFAEPYAELMTLISLCPNMVIIHAEAQGDLQGFMQQLQKLDIKAGVALLPDTPTRQAAQLIAIADHVLIFAGHLGYFGGTADMSQLRKVAEIRAIKPELEIGWDGGINDATAVQLLQGGIDVLNVGGFIQRASDPAEAFRQLQAITRQAAK